MRQWVISVPKRLRGILADRPQAMTTLSRIFLEEIERLLCHAADVPTDSDAAEHVRPRLGAVSFQHRFGSALNQHVHLHACVTDGVFKQRAAGGGVTFHAARPLTASDLATVTQRVRLRLVWWCCRKGFLIRLLAIPAAVAQPIRKPPAQAGGSRGDPRAPARGFLGTWAGRTSSSNVLCRTPLPRRAFSADN